LLSSSAARSTTPPTRWARCFVKILATFAEFAVDLLRTRTREGLAVAKAKRKLKGKQPKLSTRQQAHLVDLHHAGEHTIADLAELFSGSRPPSTAGTRPERKERLTRLPNPRGHRTPAGNRIRSGIFVGSPPVLRGPLSARGAGGTRALGTNARGAASTAGPPR